MNKEPKREESWEDEFDRQWDECFATGDSPRFSFQKQEIANFIRRTQHATEADTRRKVIEEAIDIVAKSRTLAERTSYKLNPSTENARTQAIVNLRSSLTPTHEEGDVTN